MVCLVNVRCMCCGEKKFFDVNNTPLYPFLCSGYCKDRYKYNKCDIDTSRASEIKEMINKPS